MSSKRELTPEEWAILEELYQSQYTHLYQTAMIQLKNPHLAQDIVQDTFLHAAEHIDALSASSSPGGWLYRSLQYLILHAIRTRNLLLARNIPLEKAYHLQANETGQEISALDRSNADMQLMIRYYEYGYSLSEIAEEWGITIGAAKMRIKRAKMRLQNSPEIKELKKYYF